MANVTDSFNRANAAVNLGNADTGQTWQQWVGTWGITNNTAYPSGATNDAVATVPCGWSDGTVSVVAAFAVGAGYYGFGLALRLTDASNYVRCVYESNTLYLQKSVAGTRSTIASHALTLANGDTLSVIMSGNTYTVQQNGATVFTATDSSNSTGTNHGLAYGSYSPGTQRWDNFSATQSSSTVAATGSAGEGQGASGAAVESLAAVGSAGEGEGASGAATAAAAASGSAGEAESGSGAAAESVAASGSAGEGERASGSALEQLAAAGVAGEGEGAAAAATTSLAGTGSGGEGEGATGAASPSMAGSGSAGEGESASGAATFPGNGSATGSAGEGEGAAGSGSTSIAGGGAAGEGERATGAAAGSIAAAGAAGSGAAAQAAAAAALAGSGAAGEGERVTGTATIIVAGDSVVCAVFALRPRYVGRLRVAPRYTSTLALRPRYASSLTLTSPGSTL